MESRQRQPDAGQLERVTSPAETTLARSELGIITDMDIEQCIDTYSLTLANPEELYNNRNMLFNGLLRDIYTKCIKHIIPNTHTLDYDLYDNIFINIYLPLCYRFNRVPSVNNFCNHLVGVYIANIYDIRTGTYRPNNTTKVNPKIRSLISKWDELCNTDLTDYVVHTSSIGGIFRLKTKGFSEGNNINISIGGNSPTITTDQIAAGLLSDVPALPD